MSVNNLKIDVQGMREKILDLAMRGKLVSQDGNDEPASVLLEKITQEKAQLIKKKKIKKTKPIPEITDEEKPFEIPESWEWVRLGEIVDNTVSYPMADGPFGSNLKKEHYTYNHEVRIIQLSNIGEKGWKDKNTKYTTFEHLKEIERSAVQSGDIVIAKMMPAGRAIEVPNKDKGYVLSSDAVKFVPAKILDKKFILKGINSPVFQKQVNAHLQGSTRPRTSLKKLKSYILPLPPLNEQKRIADKVKELFDLLDILEESTKKYENLQTVLKEKVLTLGMQGKLVEQDLNDEAADKLYEKIQAEKAQLIKEKKIKKTKPLSEIAEEEKPFKIPNSWKWVRVGNIGRITSGGTPKTKEKTYWINGNIPWITPAVMSETKDGMVFNNKKIKYINEEGLKHSSAQLISANSLVVSSRAPIGYINLVPFEYTTNQGCKSVSLFSEISSAFVYNALRFRVPDMEKRASGTTFKEISGTKFSQTIVPLPPLNEQKRIANKIENLFSLIDSPA